MTLSSMLRAARLFLVQAVIVSVISLALLELIVAFSFRYPRTPLLPASLVRYLHIQFDRNTIQVMPECARYDDGVTYTLRPGTCTFANREFSTVYRINSRGLRDDEASLQAPDLIMLGDSLTMGWGVEQDEAFPAVVERATGRKTLNAGISSYGTVRALKLFERLDRSALARLVIQYTDNDFGENEQFVQNGALRILTKEEYERTVSNHQASRRYVPGKYALNVLAQMRSMLRQRALARDAAAPAAEGRDREAEVFLQVLERSPVALAPYRPIVLSLDSPFIAAARRASRESAVEWIRTIEYLDSGDITALEGAFYRLDDHPTARGHAAIARALAAMINGGGAPAAPGTGPPERP